MNPSSHSRPPRRGGFTLLEFLAVILIVSVLVLVGLIGWQRSLQLANSTKCISNQRGLFQALNQYAADHAGRYPPSNDSVNGAWPGHIYPYISEGKLGKQYTGILYCPATKAGGTPPRDANGWRTDYTLNVNVISSVESRNLPIVPSTVILLYDGKGGARGSAADAQQSGRHAGFFNVMFCDGHVESMKSFENHLNSWKNPPQ